MSTSTAHSASRSGMPSKRRRKRRRGRGKQAEVDPFESEETQNILQETESAIQELLSETMPRRVTPGFTFSSQTQDWRGRLDLMLTKLDFVTDLLDPNEREYLESCWSDPDSAQSSKLDQELNEALKAAAGPHSGVRRKIALSGYIHYCDESLARLEEAVPDVSGQSWTDRLIGFFNVIGDSHASKTQSDSAWSEDHHSRLDRLYSLTDRVLELREDCVEQYERQLEEGPYLPYPDLDTPEYLDNSYLGGPHTALATHEDLVYEPHPVRHHFQECRPPGDHRYYRDPWAYDELSWGETLHSLRGSVVSSAEQAFEIGTGCAILLGGAYMAAKTVSWLGSSKPGTGTED